MRLAFDEATVAVCVQGVCSVEDLGVIASTPEFGAHGWHRGFVLPEPAAGGKTKGRTAAAGGTHFVSAGRRKPRKKSSSLSGARTTAPTATAAVAAPSDSTLTTWPHSRTPSAGSRDSADSSRIPPPAADMAAAGASIRP
jgi:hypothetical protein